MKHFTLILLFLLLILLLNPFVVCASPTVTIYPQAKDSILQQQIKFLIDEAEKQRVQSPRKALTRAQKAIELLKTSSGNTQQMHRATFETAHAYQLLGKMDSSVVCFNKLLSLPDIDAELKAKSLNLLGVDYRRLGEYQLAHQSAANALKIYRSLSDSAGILGTLMNDAKVFNNTGDKEKAMQLYFDALKYTEKVKDTLKTGQLYGLIANVYMDIDRDEKGKVYYRKAIRKLKAYQNTSLYADNLNNYGIVFYDEQVYDSALFFYTKALDVYRRIEQTDAIAVGYQNIGITYVFLDSIGKGLQFLKHAKAIFKSLKLQRDLASVYVDLGRAYIEVNRFDSADYYLGQALEVSSEIHQAFYKKEALLLRYKMYEEAGDFEAALKAFKKYVTFKDSLDNKEMRENFQELEVKYQTIQHEKEIIHLKDQELLDRAEKRLLIFGIIGLLLFFILILSLILVRRKKDMQIHRQKIVVHQKEKALARAELAQREAHEKQLENELEFKTKQLATHALNMMQKNKLLQDITEDIERRIKSPDCKNREAMIQVRHSLKQGLNVERDWDLFKLYFEQINERFFDELKKINLKLTGNDYKLCALIKLNMSVKEMASVMNISADSLKNARYRLKKKLKLRAEERLNTFIGNI